MQEEITTSKPTKTPNTFLKDLMIPLSIVIAGIFIGAGLYFGGGQSTAVPVVSDQAKTAAPHTLLDFALLAGVDEDAFKACMDGRETLALVQDDLNNAIATGGQGTPWGIMIGPSGKKYPVNGALPQQVIEQMIEVAKAEGDAPSGDTDTAALELVTPVTQDDHIRGNIDAKVVIIEYSDYDCPFCSRFHLSMSAIADKYDPSEVAWVYRHFPLESLHPNAPVIAQAAECVAKVAGEEAFWTFTDAYLEK